MTIKEWLEGLAGSSTSSEQDDTRMENLLHRLGEKRAKVTLGIAYLDGKGTMDAAPMAIQAMAKMLLEQLEKQLKERGEGKGKAVGAV